MTAFVALLRAVNVGGTGKLPMPVLASICEDAGFTAVRTYIASGNAVFRADGGEADVRDALEARLHAYAGRPVGVVVRTAREMAEAVARNPFPDAPGSRVAVLFADGALPAAPLDGAVGRTDEELRVGARELFIHYPSGMGVSRLRLPAQKIGTARNINTVAKLAEMAAATG